MRRFKVPLILAGASTVATLVGLTLLYEASQFYQIAWALAKEKRR